ncbi:hypothetical protein JOE52_002133 [Bradyrhizobium canariense]|nr:hypothetical protein [Bradyrhizobium canariense]
MPSDVDAPEQLPRQIARGDLAKEIGDQQPNRARCPKSHGFWIQFPERCFIPDFV